jgi:DNA-binding transcriptional LysR family regulator
MLDLHRLRLLREFAARGSITATASSLGYTASAVSQQLAALERETGASLLDRTASRAELTDTGRPLADHAERILAMVEEAEADVSARAQEPSGRVVVTAFPSAAVAFAPVLAHRLRAHPDLTLLLRQAAGEVGLRQVRSGGADVTIVDDWTGRLAATGDGILSYFHLVSDPLVLVVPPSHAAAAGTGPARLEDFRDDAWMAAPEGEPSRRTVDRLLAEAGVTPPVPWEFEGMGTILSLVARGIGIAIVPRLALTAGEQRVSVRALAGGDPRREVYAVARTASVRRPSVSAVLAALRAAATALPGAGTPAGPGPLGCAGGTGPVRRRGRAHREPR